MMVETRKMIQRNIGVSNVYTFLYAYFESVKFYAARSVHLKKEGREQYFFVSDEEEEDDELLPGLKLTFLV